ncbi:hypothetical protein PVBG_05434 [Plasmodium vivax Brazil I]|uniref:VIR protein n=1 Tax=Plasmodium vivax (strain Brazil I) TaxID=1033975 RepID=A0A0J9T0B8_PLAV1|nr:hypothetical protein PVBG_05434 [Plasmodium vivax Brazil I]
MRQETETGKKILEEFIDSSTENKVFVKKYDKLFDNVTKRFGGNSLLMDYGYSVCCPYINYWLNYTIVHERNDLRENNLDVFKKFADFYARKTSGIYHKDNSCEKYITPLYDNNYKINEILYKMYDMFNQITEQYTNSQTDKICSNYGWINLHYKYLKENYASNTDLNAKLDDFLNVINKSEKSIKKICDYEIQPPVSRLEVSKGAPDTRSMHRQMSGTSGELVSHTPKESEDPVTQTEPDGHSKVLAEPEVAEPGAVESHTKESAQLEATVLQPEVVQSQKVELLKAPLRERLEKVGSGARLLPGLRYQNEDTFGESLGRRDGEKGNPEYGLRNTEFGYANAGEQLSTTEGDPKGFLTNVQDTFFSIVKDVEPGPVLGVSGGMGALFLLFKVFKNLKI